MSYVCVDSGFMIGLYDESDQYHKRAEEHFSNYLDNGLNQLLVPWPILYESVSTQMVKSRNRIVTLERDWKRLQASGQLNLLDDRDFRLNAMDECLAEAQHSPGRYRALSLAD